MARIRGGRLRQSGGGHLLGRSAPTLTWHWGTLPFLAAAHPTAGRPSIRPYRCAPAAAAPLVGLRTLLVYVLVVFIIILIQAALHSAQGERNGSVRTAALLRGRFIFLAASQC
jgi:hypothetical protein